MTNGKRSKSQLWNSLRWPIYVVNLVDSAKLPFYMYTLPPTQHHSFFRILAPLFILLQVVYLNTREYTFTTILLVLLKNVAGLTFFNSKANRWAKKFDGHRNIFLVKSPSLLSFSREIARTWTRLDLFMA